MTELLKQKLAEFNLVIGGFALKKHHSRFKRLLVVLILWANRRRYRRNALQFLSDERTHDDHF